jgi:hypothetical protein
MRRDLPEWVKVVEGARKRFSEYGPLGSDRSVGLVHDRFDWGHHVLAHATWCDALETKHVVRLAYVVIPARTVPARPVGDNLLGDDPVAYFDAPMASGRIIELDDDADILMTRDHERLGVGRPLVITVQE